MTIEMEKIQARVRELDENATAGEWRSDGDGAWSTVVRGEILEEGWPAANYCTIGEIQTKVDRELIAEYRTLAPQLADGVDVAVRIAREFREMYTKVKKELEELKCALDRIRVLPRYEAFIGGTGQGWVDIEGDVLGQFLYTDSVMEVLNENSDSKEKDSVEKTGSEIGDERRLEIDVKEKC